VPRFRHLALLSVLVGASGGLLLAASEDDGTADRAERTAPRTTPRSAPRPRAVRRDPQPQPQPRPQPSFVEATCPAYDDACVAVTARVLAIESVDPDGDGDLHVIAAGGSVTGPGLTVFDVSAALRPAEDPHIGQRVTGAGPVYRGSFGQRQIEVREFRVED
jgi:hypothetical protein